MLIHNWRQVLKRAWSVRLIVLAAVLTGIEAMLPFVALPIPAGLFAGLTLVVTAAAFVARILAQKEGSDADQ
ncbi:hypothetical protein G6L34_08480 [Agrobacterium tumefaciens]|uniref:DUF7940 domain-containing protein n=1 Tax=Rhizobium/Agrobacterium group TaxID=227290 RepID=UPI0015738FAB|nr:hypothetical protein [Agrobacterium tumefaciens]NTA48133.1 hypothetical protein [Agrobacterium tumefaciens]